MNTGWRCILTLLLITIGPAVRAQYYESAKWDHWSRKYFPKDTNVIVKGLKYGRAPFLIKSQDPYQRKKNRAGFIDTNGRVIIKPIYIDVSEFRDGLALVTDSAGKRGLVNTMGHPVIPVIYDGIERFDNGLVFIYLKGKMGLMTSTGRQILPPSKYTHHAFPPVFYNGEANDVAYNGFRWDPLMFSKAGYFKKFIGVKAGQKWGVINEQGHEVVPPLFDGIDIFNNGLTVVKIDNKRGVIDTTGRMVVSAVYDNITLDGSYIFAKSRDSIKVLTYNGKELIPFKQINNIGQLGPNGFLMTDKDRRQGVMNKTGQLIIPVVNRAVLKFGSGFYVDRSNDSAAIYNKVGKRVTGFSNSNYITDGLWQTRTWAGADSFIVYNRQKDAFVTYHQLLYPRNDHSTAQVMIYGREGKWGLLDAAGNELTPAIYEQIEYAMPALTDRNDSPKTFSARLGDKWGILDHRGKVLVNFEYDQLNELKDHFLAVKDKKLGFIARPIKILTPAKYDDVHNSGYDVMHKVTAVRSGSYWGFINRQGKEITTFKYSNAWSFSAGLGVVEIDKKYGLIDTLGKEVLPCVYDSFPSFTTNYIIAQKDKAFWLFHTNGKLMRPSGYDEINRIRVSHNGDRKEQTFLSLKKGDKMGLLSNTGKTILDDRYTVIALLHDRYFIAGLKEGNGVLDLNGKVLLPFKYHKIDLIQKAYKQDRDVFTATVNGKMGVIGLDQKVLIPFAYDEFLYLDTEHPVAKKDGFYGVVNWGGTPVSPFIYTDIERQWFNRYIVWVDLKAGVIGDKGQQLVPPVYDAIYNRSAAAMIIIKDKKYGLVDSAGKVLVEPYYDAIEQCGKETLKVKKGNLFGVINHAGKVIYPCKYTAVNCAEGRVVEVY